MIVGSSYFRRLVQRCVAVGRDGLYTPMYFVWYCLELRLE